MTKIKDYIQLHLNIPVSYTHLSSGMYGKDRGPGRNPLLSETGAASLVS